MLHSSESFGGTNRERAERAWEVQRLQLARARRFPNVVVAVLLWVVYMIALIAVSGFIALWKRPLVTPVLRGLAMRHASVPELPLHKALEIEQLRTLSLAGRGIDLGCGNGYSGSVLIEAAVLGELHGVDAQPGFRSPLEVGYASYTAADMRSLPFCDQVFDYAISICVIEHIPDSEQALAEMARLVAPGGVMALTTPSPNWRRHGLVASVVRLVGGSQGQVDRASAYLDELAWHFQYRGDEQWRSEFARLGLTEIEVRPFFSSRQLLVFDLMNVMLHFPAFSFQWLTEAAVRGVPGYRQLLTWCGCVLGAYAQSLEGGVLTHVLVTGRKPGGTMPVARP